MSPSLRLAVLCDFPEEGWPSMDLVANMLVEEASSRYEGALSVTRMCPRFRRHFGALGQVSRTLFNADRLINRLGHFPRLLRRVSRDFDLFHVADHSYAALVHHLPAERTGVFCHDLDLFRCLFDSTREQRPSWFRAIARHVLRGLAKARVVFYSTVVVRNEIEQHGLVDPARLVQAPFGVCLEYTPATQHDRDAAAAIGGRLGEAPFVLNVGSCVPRKRMDVLLRVFALVAARQPQLRLTQVGGTWSPSQRKLIAQLGIGDRLVQLRGIERAVLASLYRRAAVVLLPTEAEGFGIPLVEALACGAPIVASDLAVLREVGGNAALYRSVGDVDAWAETVNGLIAGAVDAPPRSVRLDQAARYTWSRHVDTVLAAYGLSNRGAPRLPMASV